MIRAENLTKRFGRVAAVDGISFEVQEGEILGVLGPNGAGKSTTLRMIVGLLQPTAGRVVVAGREVGGDSLEVRRLIGHLPEGAPLYGDMRVSAFLRFVAEAKGVPRADRDSAVERAIEECGLGAVRGRLIRHLSKGYRQRTGLAQAVLGDPSVLVLDEPTVGLDPQQVVEIRRLIRRWAGRKTVILSTHILPEVEVTCDRVIIVRRGRLRAIGTPAHLAAASAAGGDLRLTVAGPAGEVRRCIESLPAVSRCESEPSPDASTTRLRLRGQCGPTLRRDVLAACLERGWEVLELTPLGGGLEQAYLDAIGEEEAARP